MAKKNKRPVAVFEWTKYMAIQAFIGKLRSILLNIGNNPLLFVTPNPTLASVEGHVDDLADAQAAADARTVGAAGARDIIYNTTVDDVYALLMYVQLLANDIDNVAEATALINASGFSVRINGVFQRPPLAAYNGELTGTVALVAEGGPPRSAHEWHISANNVSWTPLQPTINARTMVTGLTKLSTQYFRHRIFTKDGPQAWDQSVSIVVL